MGVKSHIYEGKKKKNGIPNLNQKQNQHQIVEKAKAP